MQWHFKVEVRVNLAIVIGRGNEDEPGNSAAKNKINVNEAQIQYWLNLKMSL